MRVLVVHRDPLPGPGGIDEAAVSGAGLRARVHVDALAAAGHEVVTLRRIQGDTLPASAPPPGLARSAEELRAAADRLAPDWVLAVSPADAPALAPVAPLMVDLYAPRLLEAAFEGRQREAADEALRALHAADEVLFSNARQRWFWMGLAGACGWSLDAPVGQIVPLAALPGPPRDPRAPPVLVAGGMPWPWQDLRPALAATVAALRGRAEVHTFGLPAVDGTIAHGRVGRAEWLRWCAGARAAIDRYAPNPERPLAYSFRQADYLGAALPLVSDPDTPLADGLRATRAGWVDEPLADAIEAALVEDRSSGAAALAADYAPAVTEAAVVAWVPRRRDRGWSTLASGARVARATERARAADAVARLATAELDKKHAEVEALTRQGQALASSVEALSAAMLDVAALRRETVQVLGSRLSGEAATVEQLRREVEVLHADLAKKNAELAALARERDHLGRALGWLRGRS